MPLNKLDNFLKNIEGRILYVNPNDLDATDAITNQGNSLAQPFKTIQRALLEAARFSYVAGPGNDIVEKTTILLFPGEHVIDNRPGWAIYDNNGAKAVSRSGNESLASSVLSLGLNSIFDLTQEDNILYKFNSYYGGVIVPRGTSIVGLDLRKTKIRPKYVPNPTDPNVQKSAIFRITGACYFWQFSFFDANKNSLVYTNPDIVTPEYQSTPNFSHHKLSCFEFCDGVNNVGTYGLTDLDMYYSKVSNAYNAYREIGEKFPESPDGFAKKNSEWEIVGAFAPDPISIDTIVSGNGSTATNVITVTTKEPHNLNSGTPIKIKGVTGPGVTFPYNISTTVQNVLTPTSFTYLLPAISSYPNINASPNAGAATVTIEVDTVSGASPYIFNISLRSVWGMNGLHADGSKASGFKSTVVAQFTGVSLQKDDRAFVKYNKTTRTYDLVPYTTSYGSSLSEGASQTDSSKVFHLDPDAIYRSGWETSHIKLTNDAFIQVVSVFAIGYTKHFDAESGGDASITNSNSNFGQISLNSSGFKQEAFDKDNKAFITSIVTPRAISSQEEDIEWLSIDVGLTTSVGINRGVTKHLYLYGFTSPDAPPSALTQGYRIGARLNDKIYLNTSEVINSNIYHEFNDTTDLDLNGTPTSSNAAITVQSISKTSDGTGEFNSISQKHYLVTFNNGFVVNTNLSNVSISNIANISGSGGVQQIRLSDIEWESNNSFRVWFAHSEATNTYCRSWTVNAIGSEKTYSASIYMCDNLISTSTFTAATGTTSSVKSYDVTSGPTSNSFTIGANNLLTGEKVKIISDDGDLPENIKEHQTYYVIKDGSSNIKLASSYTNAIQEQEITVYGGTNLHILSRVSDKDAGEPGSPIQYDAENGNWFINVDANNEIYNALSLTVGTPIYEETTDLTYVKRIPDERSLDDKLYKFRVVIPKQLSNVKPPETGFVIQESSTTGVGSSEEFTRVSIGNSDYDYNKNPRFISTCSVSSNTVTVISELPHNLQLGELVIIKNVKSTTNPTGIDNVGYNGKFVVSEISDALTFKYLRTDVNGIEHSVGEFTNDVTVRDEFLPRFERNDSKSNLFIYRNEVISPYIYNQQDGIYHLYVLNANNAIQNHFTDLKYGQLPKDLYPQLDRDNIDSNPPAAKTYAKRSPIGAVVTNDLKKSITRETVDLALKTFGKALEISSVSNSLITFSRFHGLSGLVGGTITAGSGYNNGTYNNVKLLTTSQTGTWKGATANVVVSGNSITSVEIVSDGSGYSVGDGLYFDQDIIGPGDGAARYVVTRVTDGVGSVLQITGNGTVSNQYYKISSVGSSVSVNIARGTGDPAVLPGQYGFVVGPSVEISTVNYNSTTKITTFSTSTTHGLLPGNRFTVRSSSNNNLGDFIVQNKLSESSFTAVTNGALSAVAGYILKHGLSSNDASSDAGGENFGVRNVTFYDNCSLRLSAPLPAGDSEESIIDISTNTETTGRLPLGSYIQINNEIMRVKSSNNVTAATVIRGVFGTVQESHSQSSLIKKINPIAVEFRRPSILRASGQTFEYLGYGPGNYSTALPQVQIKSLSDEENFLAQSQERSCGTVVYTGMNNSGDFFSGNTKTSSVSGETVSFDIPNPTITGEDSTKLSVVFDEVTIKERLLVEGGKSKSVLSQFNGPVNFNGELRIKSKASFSGQLKILNATQSTSPTTGALVVPGGVGIGKSLNVKETISAGSFSGNGIIPVGGVVMWSGRTSAIRSIPGGNWVLCDGRYLSKTTYDTLYKAFTANGATVNPHGSDNPSNPNEFKIPDLRDRFIIAGGGGSSYGVGTTGGSANAVVVDHEHFVASSTGYIADEGQKLQLNANNYVSRGGFGGSSPDDQFRDYVLERSTSEADVGRSSSTGESGVGKNLPPYYALCFILRIA